MGTASKEPVTLYPAEGTIEAATHPWRRVNGVRDDQRSPRGVWIIVRGLHLTCSIALVLVVQFGTAVVPIVFTELVNVLRRVLTLLVLLKMLTGSFLVARLANEMS